MERVDRALDGWRIVAYKGGPRVRLVSRRGNDHTARFPELAAALVELPARVLVLDGEVAVFDERLVSRFDLLGTRDGGRLSYRGLVHWGVGRRLADALLHARHPRRRSARTGVPRVCRRSGVLNLIAGPHQFTSPRAVQESSPRSP
jgi:hypothetical protein